MKRVSTQSTLLTCLVLSASAAFVSSCQDYEPYNDQHLKDVAYTHEFERQFGKIDPNQNWDLYGQLYGNVYGQPKRNIGPLTRATTDEDEKPTFVDADFTYTISAERNQAYSYVLPEIGSPNRTYDQSNLKQVTNNFTTTASTLTLAPAHWHTSGDDEIGIYWYVDEPDEETTRILGRDGKIYYVKYFRIFEHAKSNLTLMRRRQNGTYETVPLGTSNNHRFVDELLSNNPGSYLVSTPRIVTIPASITYYGFWIRQIGTGTKHSEWNLNPPDPEIEGNNQNHKMAYVGTFNFEDLGITDEQLREQMRLSDADIAAEKGVQHICFEDWYPGGDADLNDIVYYAQGIERDIIDNESKTEKAILVCEDLSNFDFDFNDVALGLTFKTDIKRTYEWVGRTNDKPAHYSVTSTETTESLIVEPMAAGGAFESTVSINNEEWDKIHPLLGESAGSTGDKNHNIINAGATFDPDLGKGQIKQITFPSTYDWRVGDGKEYATHLSQLFLNDYFTITCEGNKTAAKLNADQEYTESGNAPQMMLLPYYFEWPQEQINISDAYNKNDSHGFEKWVQDINQTSWIIDSQVAENVTDRGVTPDVEPEEYYQEETIELRDRITANVNFSYGDSHYSNCSHIRLSGIYAADGATAVLTVVFQTKPNVEMYLDDDNGNLVIWDNFGGGSNITKEYPLDADMLQQVISAGGIYFIGRPKNDQPQTVTISNASIKIITKTTTPATP